MAPVETPGHVLQEYRLVLKDVNQRAFADFDLKRAWTEGVQRRLEDGGTRFKQRHLDVLVNRTGLKKDSAWYRRFEAAMVGDEWPPVRDRLDISLNSTDSGGESERILVPVNLKGKSGRFKLVLELVLGFIIALVGGYLLFSSYGYNFFDLPKSKMVETLPSGPLMVGGDLPCTQMRFVGVLLQPTIDSNWAVGDKIEIDVWASGSCTWASKVRIDGKLIAWSANRRETVPGFWEHRVGYFWDTSGFIPGEHTITVEFISHWWQFTRVTKETRKIILVESR